jgi:hypothetical protein
MKERSAEANMMILMTPCCLPVKVPSLLLHHAREVATGFIPKSNKFFILNPRVNQITTSKKMHKLFRKLFKEQYLLQHGSTWTNIHVNMKDDITSHHCH